MLSKLRTDRRPLNILRRTLVKSLKDNILIFGGYAAYAALLSLFPFLIFLMAVAGMLGSPAEAELLVRQGLARFPAEIMNVIEPILKEIMASDSASLLTAGGIGTLWVASTGVEGMRFGLNKVHDVTEFRPFWKRRLESLVVVLVGASAFFFLMMLVILWPLLIDVSARYLYIPLEGIAALSLARFLFAVVLLVGLFCALYKTLPNVKQRWREVWPGALVATFLWLLLAHLFSIYLSHFGRYDATYGSIGGVIITLIFFHYSAAVILLGAELNCALHESSGKKSGKD